MLILKVCNVYVIPHKAQVLNSYDPLKKYNKHSKNTQQCSTLTLANIWPTGCYNDP